WPIIQTSVNGLPCQFVLDMGSTLAVGFMPGFGKQHPEMVDRLAGPEPVLSLIPGSTWYPARVNQVALLGHTFWKIHGAFAAMAAPRAAHSQGLILPEGDGVIGEELLEKFRLTFDYAGRRVWAQWHPPATAAELVK